jgi:hypothetical protein
VDHREALKRLEAAAEGIIRVANANMERAIRVVSVERGYDPRDFAYRLWRVWRPPCMRDRRRLGVTVIVPTRGRALSARDAPCRRGADYPLER